MKISAKGRYALSMLLDLAEHRNEGFIALKDISERRQISKKYLEQIIPVLNKANILRTTRGSHGGYMLAKRPENCTAGEILRLTENTLFNRINSIAEGDEHIDMRYVPLCDRLDRVISECLDKIILQDILDWNIDAFDYVI
ncbi:MAG: Rrf2 family transcriptional regulator [Ruminococcaceae bacterium]|nr:Rrf2 family transcriptional regulator [Oscillospiraceae bacterium]